MKVTPEITANASSMTLSALAAVANFLADASSLARSRAFNTTSVIAVSTAGTIRMSAPRVSSAARMVALGCRPGRPESTVTRGTQTTKLATNREPAAATQLRRLPQRVVTLLTGDSVAAFKKMPPALRTPKVPLGLCFTPYGQARRRLYPGSDLASSVDASNCAPSSVLLTSWSVRPARRPPRGQRGAGGKPEHPRRGQVLQQPGMCLRTSGLFIGAFEVRDGAVKGQPGALELGEHVDRRRLRRV